MWEYHQVPASTWIPGDTHRPLGEAPPAKVLKRNEAYASGTPANGTEPITVVLP